MRNSRASSKKAFKHFKVREAGGKKENRPDFFDSTLNPLVQAFIFLDLTVKTEDKNHNVLQKKLGLYPFITLQSDSYQLYTLRSFTSVSNSLFPLHEKWK